MERARVVFGVEAFFSLSSCSLSLKTFSSIENVDDVDGVEKKSGNENSAAAMEMHHKLRRDPNWHPNGCNLCGQVRGVLTWTRDLGPVFRQMMKKTHRRLAPSTSSHIFFSLFHKKKKQLGHQASVCPNGTVNWREKFGGEERWKEHFAIAPAVYASEDPSCALGNGRRQDDSGGGGAEDDGGGEKKGGNGGGGLRAPRTPARVAAQDPAAVEEAARAWAKQRKESGAAEREPVPPARKGPRAVAGAEFGGAVQQLPFHPQQQMMMMPPPPMPGGGFYPPPLQQQQGGFYGGPPPPQMMMRPPPPAPQQWQQQQQQQPPPSTSSAAAAAGAAAQPPPKPSRPVAPGSPPPAGWGKAVDSKGRTYYWNKKDKSKVSWKKPAAE